MSARLCLLAVLLFGACAACGVKAPPRPPEPRPAAPGHLPAEPEKKP